MWTVALVTLWISTAAADAPTPAERLTQAHALADALEFSEAREVLLQLVSDPRATHEELVAAHLLAGEVDRVLERDTDARMHFHWVLSRDPDAQLPAGRPPKVSAFFELVRDEVRTARGPARDTAPAAAPAAAAPAARAQSSVPLVPLLVAGVGGAVLVGGAIGASVAEQSFAQTASPWREREAARQLGVVSWAAVGVGALATTTGAALWLLEGP